MTPRSYLYAAVGALLTALVVTIAIQQARIGSLRASLAQSEAQVATGLAERSETARRHAEVLSAAQAAHATQQQEAEHVFSLEKTRLADARHDDAALVNRLRAQIAAKLPAARGPAGQADAFTGINRRDAAGDLAGLLAEGVELVAEGGRLVEQRDAEVRLLRAQIDADRTACMLTAEAP